MNSKAAQLSEMGTEIVRLSVKRKSELQRISC